MTLAFWCVFFAALLHVLTKFPVSSAQYRQPEGYDNSNPRDQIMRIAGWGRRASAAHQNQIEAFPLFASGVIIAHLGGTDPATADAMAVAWIVARLAYWALYLADRSTARSTVWMAGYGLSLALLCSPAWS